MFGSIATQRFSPTILSIIPNFEAFLRDVWLFKKKGGLIKGLVAYGYAYMSGKKCKARYGY